MGHIYITAAVLLFSVFFSSSLIPFFQLFLSSGFSHVTMYASQMQY